MAVWGTVHHIAKLTDVESEESLVLKASPDTKAYAHAPVKPDVVPDVMPIKLMGMSVSVDDHEVAWPTQGPSGAMQCVANPRMRAWCGACSIDSSCGVNVVP